MGVTPQSCYPSASKQTLFASRDLEEQHHALFPQSLLFYLCLRLEILVVIGIYSRNDRLPSGISANCTPIPFLVCERGKELRLGYTKLIKLPYKVHVCSIFFLQKAKTNKQKSQTKKI